ncbi:MAG: S41 family peptidase [Bacteroidales bacterium]|nr:S41 family peptidase [Bacteroidales bacterium]
MKKQIITGSILILLIAAGFTTIRNKDLEIVKNLDIYCTLFRELNMFYVDETSPENLVTTSINSMLGSLDPYTTYIPENEMDNFNFQTTGEYGGIGSLIRRSGNRIIIAEPYENFPAEKSGLRSGDVLMRIDGTDTENMKIEEISELLKGKPGTELEIIIERPYTEGQLTLELTREKIVITNVPYYEMLNDHTGYIRLSNFTTNASEELKNAFLDLRSNPGFSRLILDLRGNPGGLMIEAVRACNLFIDKDELIVSTKGKVKQWDTEYKTTKTALDSEIPLIVLVNRSSASAAEIVAGAMQDLDRAVVIGQRTFGKGLVQTTRPLKYNAQLKVTTAKYYIPSGRCIQALDYTHRNEDGSVGIMPDSLISEYETRNGRIVKDGGGIRPDIEIVPELFSQITLRLYTENIYFDYATKYRNAIDSIEEAATFEISENEYNDFKDFVIDKDFEYETASMKALRELIKTSKRDKYYVLADEEFDALEKKLSHDNLKDLETFRSEIKQILEEEIAGRYYYQSGRIAKQITDDVQLDRAVDLLHDPSRIDSILNGSEGALTRK